MIRIVTANNDQITTLERGSALTWEGMSIDPENLMAVEEFLGGAFGLKKPNELVGYNWSGKAFNEKYGLTGSNAYPEDLNFLSFDLDNFEQMPIDSIMAVKRTGGRWLDDIVSNNALREHR